MEKVAVTIIGAGVVGLAIAAELSAKYNPIFVLEKENTYGTGVSSRNSEVVHAGIYYPPGTLKSELCIKGNSLLTDLCIKNNIPLRQAGKYIIATDDDEVETLEKLLNNAKNCGLNSLIYKTKNEIKHEEPAISAIAGIFSPNTAVLNAHSLMDYYYARGKTSGVEFSFGIEPIDIVKQEDGYLLSVRDTDGDTFQFLSEIVINAAGLSSDKIAEMAGIDIKEAGYELHYCKGDYFLVQGEKRKMIKHLVYPVPQPKLKGLG
ncbi:MAG: FAD-dependent oxidoreductase, partial [Candidatus Margulisiibacteriota bacterium]